MTDRLDEWSLFVAVATRRSFAETARALGRSPQNVTRAVAALEKRLGTRLLHRTTRSVSLTDDGARYLERAAPLLADFEALESREEGDLHGTVTIAAPVLYGRLHVAPIVHDFLREHDGVDVRLMLHDRVVSLAEEGIDLAVRIGALADSSLRARHVGDVRLVVCASTAYLRRRGAIADIADLARHDAISLTGTSPIPDRWTFGRRVVTVRPRLVTSDVQTAIDAALAGLGVVRLLSYQVPKGLRTVHAEAEKIPVHIVQLPGTPTRAASAFVEFAAPRLSNQRRSSCVSSPP